MNFYSKIFIVLKILIEFWNLESEHSNKLYSSRYSVLVLLLFDSEALQYTSFRYCAMLPSDIFTRLVPDNRIIPEMVRGQQRYRAELFLPINSPVKKVSIIVRNLADLLVVLFINFSPSCWKTLLSLRSWRKWLLHLRLTCFVHKQLSMTPYIFADGQATS